MHASEPFFYESQDQQIFAIYHPPQGAPRGEGVVICYPAPQDIMRSYQAHVQLARLLAQQGFAVLRFDYAGTGDSEGQSSDLSLERWEANLLHATAALKKRNAVPRLSLLGTRLGAALVLRVSRQIGLKQMLLWDPIFDGVQYITGLEAAHQQMLTRDPVDPPFNLDRYTEAQCLGFRWPVRFREEIAGVSPASLETHCRRLILVQSEPDSRWDRHVDELSKQGVQVERCVVNEPMHWTDERYMKIRAFPSKTLRTISQLMGGGAT